MIIYASILIYIYINIKNGLFKSLGDGVYMFLLMFAFLVMIIQLLYYYDNCFQPNNTSDCSVPNCPKDKPYYKFSESKCVSKPKTTPKPSPSPSPKPSEPSPSPSENTSTTSSPTSPTSPSITSTPATSTTNDSSNSYYPKSGLMTQVDKQSIKDNIEGFTDEYNIVYTDIFDRANYLMNKLYKLSNIYSIN